MAAPTATVDGIPPQAAAAEASNGPVEGGEKPNAKLMYAWEFWFDEAAPKGAKQEEYEKQVHNMGSFDTIQGFWQHFNHLPAMEKLPRHCNVRLFKHGIQPMWEDAANRNGGKWVIKGGDQTVTNELWRETLLVVVGEQLRHSQDLCGVVLQMRERGNSVSIWNRDSSARETIGDIGKQFEELLQLKKHKMSLFYQSHTKAMERNSTLNDRREHREHRDHRGGRGGGGKQNKAHPVAKAHAGKPGETSSVRITSPRTVALPAIGTMSPTPGTIKGPMWSSMIESGTGSLSPQSAEEFHRLYGAAGKTPAAGARASASSAVAVPTRVRPVSDEPASGMRAPPGISTSAPAPSAAAANGTAAHGAANGNGVPKPEPTRKTWAKPPAGPPKTVVIQPPAPTVLLGGVSPATPTAATPNGVAATTGTASGLKVNNVPTINTLPTGPPPSNSTTPNATPPVTPGNANTPLPDTMSPTLGGTEWRKKKKKKVGEDSPLLLPLGFQESSFPSLRSATTAGTDGDKKSYSQAVAADLETSTTSTDRPASPPRKLFSEAAQKGATHEDQAPRPARSGAKSGDGAKSGGGGAKSGGGGNKSGGGGAKSGDVSGSGRAARREAVQQANAKASAKAANPTTPPQKRADRAAERAERGQASESKRKVRITSDASSGLLTEEVVHAGVSASRTDHAAEHAPTEHAHEAPAAAAPAATTSTHSEAHSDAPAATTSAAAESTPEEVKRKPSVEAKQPKARRQSAEKKNTATAPGPSHSPPTAAASVPAAPVVIEEAGEEEDETELANRARGGLTRRKPVLKRKKRVVEEEEPVKAYSRGTVAVVSLASLALLIAVYLMVFLS